MKQRAYQGQSGDTGFDPIAVGYGVLEKQQRRDEEVIRDLDNQRQQSQQINEKYISDLDRTFTREEQNRKELKALEDKTLDTREAAIETNKRTQDRNYKAEVKTIDNELKAFQGLAKFSQTLGEEITKYQDAKNQSDMEDEYAKALAEGLPAERQAQLAAGEEQLRQAGEVTEQIADGFAARNVSPEVVMQVRSGNKWRDYGRLKAYSEMAGRSYGPWLEGKLAEMGPQAATPQGRAAAIQNLQMEYLQQNGLYGLSADFLGPMFDRMRTSSNGLMESARKNQILQQSATMVDDAKTNLYVNRNPQSILDLYNATATSYGPDGRTVKGRGAGRDAVFTELSDVNRYQSDDEVRQLLENTITDNGQSFAQRFPGMVQDLLKDRRTGAAEMRRLDNADKRAAGEEWVGNLKEYFNTKQFSDDELDLAISKGEEQGFDVSELKAMRYKTFESKNKNYWEGLFEEKYKAGTLTKADLDNAEVPFDVKNVYLDRVNKLDAARASASGVDVKKMFTAELRGSLGLEQEGTTADSSIYPALAAAEGMYNSRFATYSQTMDPQKAAELARREVIEAISQRKGDFAVTKAGGEGSESATNRAYFTEFRGPGDIQRPESLSAMLTRVDEGGEDLLRSETIGTTKGRLKQIRKQILEGKPPSIPNSYFEIGTRLNLDPRDILDMQMEAAGLTVPPRKPTSVDTMRQETTDPALLELLKKPTYQNQQTVALQNANYTSPDPRGQSLITMATRNGWDPADLAAIFSFETGGTLDPNQPGYGAAAGRIGLIQGGPNERRAYGLGSGNWEQEMRGVERYLLDRGATPGMSMEDLYATINGGNPSAGYTPDGNGTVARSPETLAQLQIHRGQALGMLNMTVRSMETSATRDPNYMSPTLAYITGNIGPTSTGQHLDVKRTDGSYFNYNDLDEYVFVDDPELGRVPLGSVPETGDFESHTRRGSHGRDYGTFSGTNLYVANGARVVSNRGSVHGDVTTIKLPDGRMFTFLHGNAA